MIKPESCADKVTATRLWAYECMRVFHDRLIDNADQKYFKELLIELVQGQLSQSWDYEVLKRVTSCLTTLRWVPLVRIASTRS